MSILQRFEKITTFVFDVDGVLTDGFVFVLGGGLMARRMNVKDGYALQLAIKKGYRVMVISGGDSPEVRERLNKLGVHDVWMQVEDKLACLQDYLEARSIDKEEVLFMGDDIPDVNVMQFVGLACCPNDAVAEIRQLCSYISPLKGGYGCGRDVIEKVMKLKGDWTIDTSVKSK